MGSLLYSNHREIPRCFHGGIQVDWIVNQSLEIIVDSSVYKVLVPIFKRLKCTH